MSSLRAGGHAQTGTEQERQQGKEAVLTGSQPHDQGLLQRLAWSHRPARRHRAYKAGTPLNADIPSGGHGDAGVVAESHGRPIPHTQPD